MSAPNYPVVECWVEDEYEGKPSVTRWPRDESLPAVALPWALLEDAEFRDAVMDRWPAEDGAWTMFDALAAELRARAGGGE